MPYAPDSTTTRYADCAAPDGSVSVHVMVGAAVRTVPVGAVTTTDGGVCAVIVRSEANGPENEFMAALSVVLIDHW